MEILFWCLLPIFSGLWLISSSELKNVKMIGKKPIIIGEVFGTDCWEVVDADDDWVKLSKTNKKGQTRIKLMRIDDIKSVELKED